MDVGDTDRRPALFTDSVDFSPLRFAVVLAVLAGATLLGLAYRYRAGRVRAVAGRELIRPDEIGAPLGETVTLVQISTEFCAQCPAARRLLGELAAAVPGTRFVEVPAERFPAFVERFNVLATPTVFVLDAAGRLVRRANSLPARADVLAAITEAGGQLPAAVRPS